MSSAKYHVRKQAGGSMSDSFLRIVCRPLQPLLWFTYSSRISSFLLTGTAVNVQTDKGNVPSLTGPGRLPEGGTGRASPLTQAPPRLVVPPLRSRRVWEIAAAKSLSTPDSTGTGSRLGASHPA